MNPDLLHRPRAVLIPAGTVEKRPVDGTIDIGVFERKQGSVRLQTSC
jgi:hypothetical protein